MVGRQYPGGWRQPGYRQLPDPSIKFMIWLWRSLLYVSASLCTFYGRSPVFYEKLKCFNCSRNRRTSKFLAFVVLQTIFHCWELQILINFLFETEYWNQTPWLYEILKRILKNERSFMDKPVQVSKWYLFEFLWSGDVRPGRDSIHFTTSDW